MLLDRHRHSLLTGAFLAVLLLLGGCDNTLDPVSEKSAFSIYGYLDLSQQRQVIRVKALNDPLTSDSTRTLDATVTLENLADGTTTTFKDSLIAFESIYTHNFWADLSVQPETQYHITVERSDGTATKATATTPAIVEADLTPTEGHCLTTFSVVFPGIKQLRQVRAWVGFRYDGGTFWISQNESLGKQAQGKSHNDGPSGADVRFSFTPESVLANEIESVDNPGTRFQLEPRCWELDNDQIYVAFTHLGPDWFGDVPDEVRFDPTESPFVENGLGFFGALQRDTLSVTVDTSDVIPITP